MYYHYNTVICTNQVFILYLYVVFAVNCPEKSACLKLLYIYTHICIFIHGLCKEYTCMALRTQIHANKSEITPKQNCPTAMPWSKIEDLRFQPHFTVAFTVAFYIVFFFERSCREIMQKSTSNRTTTDEKKAKPPPRVLPRKWIGGIV